MDPKKQTGSIPSVRTFAKDLESKRAVVRPTQPAPQAAVKTTQAEPQAEDTTDHEYQTPSWTAQKDKLVTAPAKAAAIAVTQNSDQEPTSASSEAIFSDTEESAEATIIRDTKKDRFRLFPAIISSLKSWSKKQEKELAAKKLPKFTVADASNRKEVIQRATSKTGKVVSFDANTIQDRVRRRKEKSAPPSLPNTIWTARTEPVFPLLENSTSPEVTVSKVAAVPRKSVITQTPKAPILAPKEALASPQVKAPQPTNRTSASAAASSTKQPKPAPVIVTFAKPETVVPKAASYANVPKPITATSNEVINAPTPVTETVAPETPSQPSGFSQLKFTSLRDWLFAIDINMIAIGVTGLILAIGIVGGTGYLWFTSRVAPLNLAITPNHETILNAPLQMITVGDYSRENLFATINQNAAESTFEVLQLALTTTPSGETLVPPLTILSAARIDIDTSLERSLTQLFFGVVRKTEPVLLMVVTDHTTAQGGLLAWEETMFTDLQPLFSTRYTAEELATARFTDSIIGTTDVRTLTTSRNEEMLVYGIINKHTIVITRNSATLREIIPLVK